MTLSHEQWTVSTHRETTKIIHENRDLGTRRHCRCPLLEMVQGSDIVQHYEIVTTNDKTSTRTIKTRQVPKCGKNSFTF
jgi:hypothetical protein